MSEEEDPKIVLSPLSCTFLEGDLQVDVHIFRLEDSKEWSLEVIDEDNTPSSGTKNSKRIKPPGRLSKTMSVSWGWQSLLPPTKLRLSTELTPSPASA